MFGIGLPELLVILGLALIVLGPEKLPQVAKQVARFVGELKKASEDFKKELEVEELEKLKNPIKLDNLLDEELEKDILSPEKIAKGSDDSDLPGGLDSSWKIAEGPASRRDGSPENGAAEKARQATGSDSPEEKASFSHEGRSGAGSEPDEAEAAPEKAPS